MLMTFAVLMLTTLFTQLFGSGVILPREIRFYIIVALLLLGVRLAFILVDRIIELVLLVASDDPRPCDAESQEDDGPKDRRTPRALKGTLERSLPSHPRTSVTDKREDLNELVSADESPQNMNLEELTEKPEERNETYRKYIDWMEKAILERDQEIEELKKKVEKFSNENEMKDHMTDLESLNQEKENELPSMTAEMETLNKDMADEKIAQKKEEEESKIMILEKTISNIVNEKDNLRQDLIEKEIESREMKNIINSLKDDLETIREDNKKKNKEIESLEKENVQKDCKIDRMAADLEEALSRQQKTIVDLQQLESCKIALEESRAEIERLEGDKLKKDKEIIRMVNDQSILKSKTRDLERQVQNLLDEKERANITFKEMERKNVQLEFQIEEAKEQLELLEFEKLEKVVQLEGLEEERLEKDRKISCLESELKVLREQKVDKSEGIIKEMTLRQKAERTRPVNKPRCLRVPQIDCRAIYRQMDEMEVKLNQIRAQNKPPPSTRKDTNALPNRKATNKPNLVEKEKPRNAQELHKKMRQETAQRLRALETDAKMTRELYKINAVT
ncbi:calponin homology domain-containing protein DDB_G0272472-like [Macrobrachium rosenbergii]|uniref:calponin homology domain-containing protein DDB_G0272472-like n=1 Tax=Macrobrachium rosenbergii TaxID=79674 RepID=UPI0034D56309